MWVLNSFAPAAGATTGSTTVTVTGSGLYAVGYCRFGTAGVTVATATTSTIATCVSPAAAAARAVYMEWSNNNVDFTTARLPFVYFGALFVVSSTLLF